MQKVRINHSRKDMVFLLLILWMLCFSLFPVSASERAAVNNGWIRAKFVLSSGKNLPGFTQDLLTVADGWTKDRDGWWYYERPIKSGDDVTLLTNVTFPVNWANEDAGMKFSIRADVQVAEAMPGEKGFSENDPISYETTYEIANIGYKHPDNVAVVKGGLTAEIHEYQKDENGTEIPYQNDKTIVPGQKIDKIIRIRITGKPGGWNLIPRVWKTGDSSRVALYIGGGIAAAAVIVNVIKWRKKS